MKISVIRGQKIRENQSHPRHPRSIKTKITLNVESDTNNTVQLIENKKELVGMRDSDFFFSTKK